MRDTENRRRPRSGTSLALPRFRIPRAGVFCDPYDSRDPDLIRLTVHLMPRFVLLAHDHPVLHWDFMLEHGDTLLTWRLSRIPAADGNPVPAEPLPDHRTVYLDYEGPVSGNRGTVRRVDAGLYEWQTREDGRLEIQLTGQLLRGRAALERVAEPLETWTFRMLEEPREPTGERLS